MAVDTVARKRIEAIEKKLKAKSKNGKGTAAVFVEVIEALNLLTKNERVQVFKAAEVWFENGPPETTVTRSSLDRFP